MAEVTLSSKNQIVIPKEAREALGLKPGDKLLVTAHNGTVTVMKRPAKYHLAIRGLLAGTLRSGLFEEGARKLETSRIKTFLTRHTRIALDTNIFIYSLENHPKYADLADEVLKWVEQPGHAAVTSTLTVTEILVKPYRTLEEHGVRQVYEVLLTYPNLEWITPDLEIADLAARLRARYRLETPDAIQAATAIHSGATALVTNDASFEKIPAFKTLLLDRLL